jgi:hypothetical protein
MRSSGVALRTATLVLLCLLVAFGAAAASIVDSLDGDDDFSPGGEIPALLIHTRCSPPPPAEMARALPPERGARISHAPIPPPTSLRAPPAR